MYIIYTDRNVKLCLSSSGKKDLFMGEIASKNANIPLVFIVYGCSFHYAHIWSKSGNSFLFKASGYIERVVKFDFFSFEKDLFTLYVRNMF